jgi:phage tail-like protein
MAIERGEGKKEGRKDPYLGLSFFVEFDGVQVATFAECNGLTAETEVFEYAEGGENGYTHRLPVRTRYTNVVLKRGLSQGQDLYRWYMETVAGKAKRKNATITMYVLGQSDPAKQWHMREAYPVKWVGPDLTTDSGSTVFETLEFAHHGVNEIPTRK